MLPIIVEKSSILLQRVHQLARLGATFSLVQLTGNLTFDVISSVAMDRDFGAQSENQQDDFIRTYHELFESYASEQVDLPWFLTPRLEWRRRRLAARLHRTLKSVVIDAFAKRKAGLGAGKSRSILSLSLQNVETLTTDAINEACDQLKTFLFAGHDTTSILISWMVYELWRAPRALRAMRAEVVEVFGPGKPFYDFAVESFYMFRKLRHPYRSNSLCNQCCLVVPKWSRNSHTHAICISRNQRNVATLATGGNRSYDLSRSWTQRTDPDWRRIFFGGCTRV